ncbi:MAG: YfiR family protein [Pseudomonadota bacterium]
MLRRRALVIAILGLVALPRLAWADDYARQTLLLLRILAYDRNLKERAGPNVNILILYRKGDTNSERARAGLKTALDAVVIGKLNVSGLPVSIVERQFGSIEEVSQQLAQSRFAALFVCEGLEKEIPAIAQRTRRSSVLSFIASESGVRAGISVGLVYATPKVRILVNRDAVLAEGVRFDAGLLRVAEIVR